MQGRPVVDRLLTNVSSAYVPTNFIADKVLPTIGVKQTSGKLGKYGQNYLRIQSTIMVGRAPARRVELITRDTATYYLERHGLEGVVGEEDYDNVEEPFDAERDETLGLTTAVMLGKEKALADTLTSSSIMTQYTTLSGTGQWSDRVNSDPLGDAKVGNKAVYDGCGVPANTLILSWVVLNELKYNPAIMDMLGFKFARTGSLSEGDIMKAFDVQKIFVGSASYVANNEGQGDSSFTSLWGKHAILAYIPDKAEPYQVSPGYHVIKKGATRRVSKYAANNPPGATAIVVDDYWDMFITNVKAAYLIKDAVA